MRPPNVDDDDPNRLFVPVMLFPPPNVVLVTADPPNIAFFAPGPSSSDGLLAPNNGFVSVEAPKRGAFVAPDGPKLNGAMEGAAVALFRVGAIDVTEVLPKRGRVDGVEEDGVDPNRGVEEGRVEPNRGADEDETDDPNNGAEEVETVEPNRGTVVEGMGVGVGVGSAAEVLVVEDDPKRGIEDPLDGTPSPIEEGTERVDDPNRDVAMGGIAVEDEAVDETGARPNKGAAAGVAVFTVEVDEKREEDGAAVEALSLVSPFVVLFLNPNEKDAVGAEVPNGVEVEVEPNIGMGAVETAVTG